LGPFPNSAMGYRRDTNEYRKFSHHAIDDILCKLPKYGRDVNGLLGPGRIAHVSKSVIRQVTMSYAWRKGQLPSPKALLYIYNYSNVEILC
jgi:hypothetical protein